MRNIKPETLEKCLSVLKEMKYAADNDVKVDPKNIASKHRTSEAIPTAAKKVGFFTTTGFGGKLICNKDYFDPIDARKVLDNIYNKRNRKRRKIHNTSLLNKQEQEKNNNDQTMFYEQRGWELPNKEVSTKFIPPKFEEVEKYCNERKNDVNPAKFMAFYEQNGWHVGKNKMKNWKMSIHTWEHKNYVYQAGKKLSDFTDQELVDELKRRGYTGIVEIKNTISF